jgi:hypothetical protein
MGAAFGIINEFAFGIGGGIVIGNHPELSWTPVVQGGKTGPIMGGRCVSGSLTGPLGVYTDF